MEWGGLCMFEGFSRAGPRAWRGLAFLRGVASYAERDLPTLFGMGRAR